MALPKSVFVLLLVLFPVLALAVLLLVLGVVFPAVWSRRARRRADAYRVLALLLNRMPVTAIDHSRSQSARHPQQ